MKKIWIPLLMLPLFCIGETEADMTGSRAVNASSRNQLSLAQNNNSLYRRQVYRRKHSSGIKSLSDSQISDRTVFDPSVENARNRRASSAGIRTANNSNALARWKESQKSHTRKFVPSDVFRKFSLVSSSGRVSSFRASFRKKSSSHGRRSPVHHRRSRTRSHRR